jgi:uncharacterized protein YaaQ
VLDLYEVDSLADGGLLVKGSITFYITLQNKQILEKRRLVIQRFCEHIVKDSKVQMQEEEQECV